MDVDSKLSEIYSSDYESNSKSKSEGSSDSGNPIRREEVKNNEGQSQQQVNIAPFALDQANAIRRTNSHANINLDMISQSQPKKQLTEVQSEVSSRQSKLISSNLQEYQQLELGSSNLDQREQDLKEASLNPGYQDTVFHFKRQVTESLHSYDQNQISSTKYNKQRKNKKQRRLDIIRNKQSNQNRIYNSAQNFDELTFLGENTEKDSVLASSCRVECSTCVYKAVCKVPYSVVRQSGSKIKKKIAHKNSQNQSNSNSQSSDSSNSNGSKSNEARSCNSSSKEQIPQNGQKYDRFAGNIDEEDDDYNEESDCADQQNQIPTAYFNQELSNKSQRFDNNRIEYNQSTEQEGQVTREDGDHCKFYCPVENTNSNQSSASAPLSAFNSKYLSKKNLKKPSYFGSKSQQQRLQSSEEQLDIQDDNDIDIEDQSESFKKIVSHDDAGSSNNSQQQYSNSLNDNSDDEPNFQDFDESDFFHCKNYQPQYLSNPDKSSMLLNTNQQKLSPDTDRKNIHLTSNILKKSGPLMLQSGIQMNTQRQNSVFVEGQKMIQIDTDATRNKTPVIFGLKQNSNEARATCLANIPKDSNSNYKTMSQKSSHASMQSNQSHSKQTDENSGGSGNNNKNQQNTPPTMSHAQTLNKEKENDKINNNTNPNISFTSYKVPKASTSSQQQANQQNQTPSQIPNQNTVLNANSSQKQGQSQNQQMGNQMSVDKKIQNLNKYQKNSVVKTNLSDLQTMNIQKKMANDDTIMSNNDLGIYKFKPKDKYNTHSIFQKQTPMFSSPKLQPQQPISNDAKSSVWSQQLLDKQNNINIAIQGVAGPQIPVDKIDQQQQSSPQFRTNQMMKFSEKIDQKILQDNEPLNQTFTTLMSQQTFNEDIINLNQPIQSRDSFIDFQQSQSKNHSGELKSQQMIKKQADLQQYDEESPKSMIYFQVQAYPDIIEQNGYYYEQFNKQYGDIIGKRLKKLMKNVQNIDSIRSQYKKSQANQFKKTLIIALDECILKTSIFKDEFPRVDGFFDYQKLKIYACFRKDLKMFLEESQKYYEIIAWTSSTQDYSNLIVNLIEKSLSFKFDHVLSLSNQTQSQDNDFFQKNIDILTGPQANRCIQEIIIVDCQMQNFTSKLTNGIFLPAYRLHEDATDQLLKSLLMYILSFKKQNIVDVRQKIKSDFNLLEKFNDYKQTQAFNKIQKRSEIASKLLGSDDKAESPNNNK